jgi:hypothetical protein
VCACCGGGQGVEERSLLASDWRASYAVMSLLIWLPFASEGDCRMHVSCMLRQNGLRTMCYSVLKICDTPFSMIC